MRLVLKVTLNTPAMRQFLYEPAEPAAATLVSGQLSWLLMSAAYREFFQDAAPAPRLVDRACDMRPRHRLHFRGWVGVAFGGHWFAVSCAAARLWLCRCNQVAVKVMVPALLLGSVVMHGKPLVALEARVLAMRAHWSISPAMCADSVAASAALVAMACASAAARAFCLSRLASACVARWLAATASCFVRADILASAGCAPFATSGPARCAAMALISVNARAVSTCAWRAPPLSAPDTTQSRPASVQ
ncbi:hypothetical protein ERJ75_001472400 [Trypanosoma vivax]|nr:hypothetical protein ERJ75_001472400 [Trypanosoma vivax]